MSASTLPSVPPPPAYFRIQDLALEDRPREKLIEKGCSALSNAELLGILIGSGTPQASAVDLARHILQQENNDLNQLAQRSVQELQAFKGIGKAKAVTIVSALELTRRRTTQHIPRNPFLADAQAVYNLMRRDLADKPYEQFWVIFLNASCRLLHKACVSTGGTSGTLVDARVVFKLAAVHSATQLILVHNHPSGNPAPSPEDERLTRKLVHAAAFNDCVVADHLIFTEATYFSFKDEGLLPAINPQDLF